ncbi:MAG TPA: type III-B CRISPR module-associated Cmr3 family protein [Verrucomicrobiae bacterium]|nr:type III-B CRISPR module-associated Cmr3 family protein [Verrucomicrobiae bacterium]
MSTVLLEPTDVLFFRDAIPMSAGQGKGAGCRMPFPSTLHEAFRTSLLLVNGSTPQNKEQLGRPKKAIRSGNWHNQQWAAEDRCYIASKAFSSLRTAGPLPFLVGPFAWKEMEIGQHTGLQVTYDGLLLPVPLDIAFYRDESKQPDEPRRLTRLKLWRDPSVNSGGAKEAGSIKPLCLPVATTPPDKHGQLHGWWTVAQYRAYLGGESDNTNDRFRSLPTDELWQSEHRIGVEINPASFAAAEGQLYAGSFLRAHAHTRFAAQLELGDARAATNGEAGQISNLDWLLLGGERRLARVWQKQVDNQPLPDFFADLKTPPAPPAADGPCLLKWVLVTPAIFAHGNLPGWCWNDTDGLPVGQVRLGASQRKADRTALPGHAHLVSWCLGRPLTVSGWDVVEQRAKPTQLAVPAGSVFYFLCENRPTAVTLAARLHWQPRSDHYGEKGCGYGLCSFAVETHATSPDVRALAKELFNH